MFGSTLAVAGVTPDVQPDLESVRTYSFDEKYYRKLFFKDGRLVGAIMIGPPKGRKKLIEIMRSRQKIERPREELLDPANEGLQVLLIANNDRGVAIEQMQDDVAEVPGIRAETNGRAISGWFDHILAAA